MKVKLSRTNTFVPTWNENDELPEEEQIKVHYKYLTTEDRNNFVIYSNNMSVASIAKEVFLKSVEKIENLYIEVDGEEVEATPEQIIDMPDMYELFSEISTEIITASSLDEEDKKK